MTCLAVCAAIDGVAAAVIGLSDRPKEEAGYVVRTLQQQGIGVYMVTGDNKRTASNIAVRLGTYLHDLCRTFVTPYNQAFLNLMYLRKFHQVAKLPSSNGCRYRTNRTG